jgi:Na+/H+ antiporter NhaD/arsenite permease-like protein
MFELLVAAFVLTYAAIALEEPLKISKSATALVGAGALWTIYSLATGNAELIDEQLGESLIETAQIAFFLMGAMTVVEVVAAHDGFDLITSRLRARTQATLLIFLCFVSFFLSAVLDNLTTTIVMVSLVKRLLRERHDRLLMAGMIVISANAGGAWSPIGDVTTTMLWIGGQVTSEAIVTRLFVPSLVNMLVPLAIVAWSLRGKPIAMQAQEPGDTIAAAPTPPFERNLMFALGLAALLWVPLFKAITHLPPFLGILFGLGVIWTIGEILHRKKSFEDRQRVTIVYALTRIDMSALVFFIGILLAVATLEHAGVLASLAAGLDALFGRLDLIVLAIGLVSAVIDNVPMVAAAMGMYSLEAHPQDSFLWEFMAYCAGTGGSILIIGSAAGVAAMSIEKIEFIWYMKRFSLLAIGGYVAGALVYIAQYQLVG